MSAPGAARAWEMLTAKMSPQEKSDLGDALDYLREKAYTPSGYIPEGSVASFINTRSPAVRDALAVITEHMSTPRTMPFTEKYSEAQNAELLGMDGRAAEHILSALDSQEVLGRVQQNMGTDAELPAEPPSTRDIMSAAYDHFSGEQS